MRKLYDFQLVLGFIGFMLTVFTFDNNPTFSTALSMVIFLCFMCIGGFKGFEEDKQCEED